MFHHHAVVVPHQGTCGDDFDVGYQDAGSAGADCNGKTDVTDAPGSEGIGSDAGYPHANRFPCRKCGMERRRG